jgi:hypothetical protein
MTGIAAKRGSHLHTKWMILIPLPKLRGTGELEMPVARNSICQFGKQPAQTSFVERSRQSFQNTAGVLVRPTARGTNQHPGQSGIGYSFCWPVVRTISRTVALTSGDRQFQLSAIAPNSGEATANLPRIALYFALSAGKMSVILEESASCSNPIAGARAESRLWLPKSCRSCHGITGGQVLPNHRHARPVIEMRLTARFWAEEEAWEL